MNRRLALAAPAALAAAAALAGCGTTASASPPHLAVSGAYVPQPMSRDMAAGFLTVTNIGGSADKLTSVTSPDAGEVSIHRTVDDSMRKVASLPVPAHGSLRLAHGGNHLMLMMMRKKLVRGDHLTLRLHFASSRTRTVQVPVKSATYTPPSGTQKR